MSDGHKIVQTATTPRELAPSPYFLLCRYTLLISMCLQKLMNIHHCVFKILGKKSKCRGQTLGRTDNVKIVYPTTKKVCRGIKRLNFITLLAKSADDTSMILFPENRF